MGKYHVWLFPTLALSDSLWLTLSLLLLLILAPSGAHRVTRSLLDSLRRCCIAPVFAALVLDNHHITTILTLTHLDHQPQLGRCCSPVRVALSVDSDLHLGTGVRERSRLIPRLRCTPRVISHACCLFNGFSAVLDCHNSTLAINGGCCFPPWPVNCWTITHCPRI